MRIETGLTAVVAALVVSLAAPSRAQQGADVALAKGIAQVQEGSLDDGVATLNGVVRRLTPVPGRRDSLAQAHLWLGIAYAQLNLEKAARASFREALANDPKVRLPEGRPPKVTRMFPELQEESAVYERVERLLMAGKADEAEAAYATAADPNNPDAQLTIASMYWDKAFRDPRLTDAQKDQYADLGLEHVRRALEIKPNVFEAIVYEGLLLRIKAMVATDAAKRSEYLTEASQLQKRAAELRRSGAAEMSGARLAPPPPPPGAPVGGVVGSRPLPPPPPNAVRIGGAIKEPRNLKHVNPVYPDVARQARVQGVVIMECTIDAQGKVSDVRVLRGVPLLDAAAIDAVRQWEYTPTLVNGVPVPVIMTVTVNFRLADPPPAPDLQ
ncbi:MAG TPA: energy transducer TonB [Vicinamibacteria bacterium]